MTNISAHEHDEKGYAIAAALLAELTAFTQAEEAHPLSQSRSAAEVHSPLPELVDGASFEPPPAV